MAFVHMEGEKEKKPKTMRVGLGGLGDAVRDQVVMKNQKGREISIV